MAVVDGSPELKRLLTSAGEVMALFRRALDARRLYVPGHPSIVTLNEQLHGRLTTHLLEFGELQLHVSSLMLALGDKPVLQAERREESISHALFLDGVRALTIVPRIPMQELATLTEIWHETIHPAGDEGQTFPTRLWEAGLNFVRAETVDALVDSAADAEEIENLLSAMHAGKAPFRSVPMGTLATQLNASGSFEADINARPTAQSNTKLFEQVLSVEEARQFADELHAQRNQATMRALSAIVQLAGTASPEQLARTEKAAGNIFAALARAGAFAELAKVVRNIAQAIRAARKHNGQPSPVLVRLMQQLDSPDIVTAALDALSKAEVNEHALEVLRYLPGRSVGTLLEAMAQQPDALIRNQLVEVISGILPEAEPLAARIASAEVEASLLIVQIAQTLPVEDRLKVLGMGLTHASPQVKQAILKFLKTADVPALSATLRTLTNDPDPSVRRSAMDLLIRGRDPEAAKLLGARLNDPKLPPQERKTLYVALGTLGGDVACLALRTEFRSQRDTELRSACALALAHAGDEYSRPVLESTAKKLLAPRALKEACTEALKRLDMKKSHRSAAEGSV